MDLGGRNGKVLECCGRSEYGAISDCRVVRFGGAVMDDVTLKAWAELSQLALKLNDSDKFSVFLEMAGHVESFYLRIGYDADAKCFQLPITSESEILISQIDLNVSNIKAARDWLTARHSEIEK